jgi:hypothetical protein
MTTKKVLQAALERGRQERLREAAKQAAPQQPPVEERVEPEEDLEQRDPSPDQSLPDISESIYDLQINIYLGTEIVSNKTRTLKLNEFKVRSFLAETIKLIVQRANKADGTIQWSYGRTEIRHKGLKRAADSLKHDINDPNDWDEVEGFLRTWMKREYQELRVDLNLHFKVSTIEARKTPMAPIENEEIPSTNVSKKRKVSLMNGTYFAYS